MFVISAALFYCQNILTADLKAQGADIFTLNAYWQEQYAGLSLPMTLATNLIMIVVMGFLYFKDQRSAAKENKPISLYLLLLLIPLGACTGYVVNGMINLLGLFSIFSNDYLQMSDALYHKNLILEFFTLVLAAPIAEELLFRGVCYERLKYIFPVKQAVFASAVLFGVYHGNALQGIYAFLLALAFGWSKERFSTILAPVLLHISANLLSFLLTECSSLNEMLHSDLLTSGLTLLIFGALGCCCFAFIEGKSQSKTD